MKVTKTFNTFPIEIPIYLVGAQDYPITISFFETASGALLGKRKIDSQAGLALIDDTKMADGVDLRTHLPVRVEIEFGGGAGKETLSQ